MSWFSVIKSKIKSLENHSNADNLLIAKIEDNDYNFVVMKNEFNVGDEVVYFPIDSVLPNDLIEYLDIRSYLFGKEKNRVKTIKLRGEFSQGLCVPKQKIDDFLKQKNIENVDDYTLALEITKYEPEPIFENIGTLIELPDFCKVYDIENVENFSNILEKYTILNRVVITEKVEGTNFSVAYDIENDKFYVNQKNYSIVKPENNLNKYWYVAEKLDLFNKIKILINYIDENYFAVEKNIILRGELVGPKIQKNIYRLPDYDVYFFDIEIDSEPIIFPIFKDCIKFLGLKTVPILYENVVLSKILKGKTLKEFSIDYSVINNNVYREGIVIRTMDNIYVNEENYEGFVILKQKNPEYLIRYK